MKHASSLALLFAPLLVLAAPTAALQGAGPWTGSTLATTVDGLPADVDGDGDLDVFTDDGWLENAAGNGSSWVQHPAPLVVPRAVADVDGDGDLDVFGPSSWHENAAGDGSAWTAHPIAGLGATIDLLEAGDVDGDGDLDAVSLRQEAELGELTWIENAAGDGSTWTLHTVASFTIGIVLIPAVAVADLDDDGDEDVVYLRGFAGGPTVVWSENLAGDGSAWSDHTISGRPGPRDLAVADVDGDGSTDVVSGGLTFAGTGIGGLYLHRNTAGDGSAWATSSAIFPTVQSTQAVGTADVDRDGDQDVLAIEAFGTTTQQVRWFENVPGDGSAFDAHLLGAGAGISSASIRTADLDRNGALDVLTVFLVNVGVDGELRWWRNGAPKMPGIFCGRQLVDGATPEATAADLVDMDGDGDLDVLAASRQDGDVTWFQNLAGDGSSWSPTTVSATTASPSMVIDGDLDGDGDPDVLSIGTALSWHENLAGDGTSWSSHLILDAPFGGVIGTADLDGDGDLDVMLARSFAAVPVVWLENLSGDATSWSENDVELTNGATWVEAADVDRDGDLDLVAAWTGGLSAVVWYANDAGDGSSWTLNAIGIGGGTAGFARAGDIDGDGDPDVVSRDLLGVGLTWHENVDGAGTTWSQHPFVSGVNFIGRVVLEDLDGDADLDVLAADGGVIVSPPRLLWYENGNGDGTTWTERIVLASPGPDTWWATAGDIDGDGDPDAVLTSYVFGTVEWAAYVRMKAVEQVRLGVPANADALRPGLTSAPVMGEIWDPFVDHSNFQPGALFDVLGLSAAPLNIPTQYGTVLCTPPIATAVNPAGVPFEVPITEDCALLGVGFHVQAASWNGMTLEATNALDVLVGTW